MLSAVITLAFYALSAVASPVQLPFTALSPHRGNSSACPGYRVTQDRATKHGHRLLLLLAGPPCHAYGIDDKRLIVEIDYETEHRIRLHIFDAERKHVAYPEDVLPTLGPVDMKAKDAAFRVDYQEAPFAFWISRRSNGEILFDTRTKNLPSNRPLVFEDQYLQLASSLPVGANIYGLGEVASTSGFRRDEKATRQAMWSSDKATTIDNNLYGAHPVYLDHRPGSGSHVVFLKSSHPMDVVLEEGLVEYRALGGNLDFYFIEGPTPKQAIQNYVSLIGLPQLQPKWTLGFHLCRWQYETLQDIKDVVRKMKEAQIPLDTQWVDIDYMAAWQDFTVDNERFPPAEFAAFVNELQDNGQHFVPIVDLGIAVGDNDAYNSGLELDVYVKHYDGSPYTGKVWPGYTTFPDYFAKNTLKWWTDAFRNFTELLPADGFWLDMNEASNFCDGGCDAPGREGDASKRFPAGADRLNVPPYHINTEEGLAHRTIWPSVRHANSLHQYDVHNLNGITECQTTNKALRQLRPNERPFLLSRSTSPGSGTVTAHWLGDNHSTWEQMRLSLQGVLQFGLYGVPLVGPDVCGFGGNSTGELCGRWMQLGALIYPFFRNHNVEHASSQEPYIWESVADISRKAMRIRYSLMPYWYTLLADAAATGTPITRALFWEWSADASLVAIDRQVMVGSALLVTPVLDEGATEVEGVLPGKDVDIWYDYYTYERLEPGRYTFDAPRDKVPMHVRGGEILLQHREPGLTIVQSERGPFELLVAVSRHGQALGHAYFDDGVSLTGKNSTVTFTAARGCLVGDKRGDYHIASLLTRVTILGSVEGSGGMDSWSTTDVSFDLNRPFSLCFDQS